MPCHYVIDQQHRLVISTGWGRLTFAEADSYQHQLKNDPDFDPAFHQLLDATAVTALDMSAQQAKILIQRSLFRPTSRRAFVATSPALYGMGRLIAVYGEMACIPQQIAVFYDRQSALEWLGAAILRDLLEVGEPRKVEVAASL